MSDESAIETQYDDITKQVKSFAYGKNLDSPDLWDLPEHSKPEELREKCTYTLKDGSTISGTLHKVQSCATAPRTLTEIKTANNEIKYISGRLFGSPSNLGVSLDEVVEIQ